MSVETTNRVWKCSQKGGAALLLLLAMADWSDDWGYCHPSVDQMAVKCRQSERNILNLIQELERGGELRRVARGKGGRGKSSGSVYQVTAGMTPAEVSDSVLRSPLARATLARLQEGEMSPPAPRKTAPETGEKFSPENFSGEKPGRDFSPVCSGALNVLINTSDSMTPPAPAAPQNSANIEALAENLYRRVRPRHLTLPNSEQRPVAIKVLNLYLQRYGSLEAAAETLKPYATEADARGISPTNLCWLSEWAAVGQIPPVRRKGRGRTVQADVQPDTTDYEAMRRRVQVELSPFMAESQRSGK